MPLLVSSDASSDDAHFGLLVGSLRSALLLWCSGAGKRSAAVRCSAAVRRKAAGRRSAVACGCALRLTVIFV